MSDWATNIISLLNPNFFPIFISAFLLLGTYLLKEGTYGKVTFSNINKKTREILFYISMGLLFLSVVTLFVPYKSSPKLQEHPIFETLERGMNTRLYNLGIHNAENKKVARKLLLIKLDHWNYYLKDLISNENIKTLKNKELQDYLRIQQDKAISSYEIEWRRADISQEVIEMFHKIHYKNTEGILRQLDRIVYSKFFHDFDAKIIAMLNANLYMYDTTITSMEEAFNEGKFDNLSE